MDHGCDAIVIGIGATALMDLWAVLRRHLFGVAPPDYGLVGRWLAYMPRGRFVHRPIAASSPIRGERALGWLAHYAIGIAFAGALIGLWGGDWLQRPTLMPALLIGLGSVVAPFFLMQPGMGAGIASRRHARPAVARLHSVVNHAVFGVGLYAAAWITRLVQPA
jgi:hypothetical protein